MDEKSLKTLEFDKIQELVAGYCDFSYSTEKALLLKPSRDLITAKRWLSETEEAVSLLVDHPETSIGGARDIRQMVGIAQRGGVLNAPDLLDIKGTLISSRILERKFERLHEQYPLLADIAAQFPPPLGLVDSITRTVSSRGEILDSASEHLGDIRRDLRITHDRLLARLEKLVSSPEILPMLQEALITQRDGRYVLPLKSEFKGRIKAVVHDQSSSGATLFIEPLTVVDLNNQCRELQLAERDEERRIMAELSASIGAHSVELEQVLNIIADLDVCFARAKYAVEIGGEKPKLLPVENGKSGKSDVCIRLFQARHPLLDPQSVVPIDLVLPQDTYALVITGPNTGGKTVTLKTAGLLTLMAQSGLFIPAQPESELSLFEGVYADIGDEQSIQQSLSTFSGHIKNIIKIIENADRKSLVILDELGAGTDPQEGAALARSLLKYFTERGITTIVSTHHPELKIFAHATEGVENASVEFDVQTLQPTFRLAIGLPGRSNAIAIAKRLGMPEIIIQDSRTDLSPLELQADDLLDDIQRQKELARAERLEAENFRLESEKLNKELSQRLEGIENERQQILEQAQEKVDQNIIALKVEIEKIRRKSRRSISVPVEIETAAEEAEELEEEFEIQIDQPTPKSTGIVLKPLKIGDKVRHRKLDTRGIVTSLDNEEAEIQVGMLRIRTSLDEIEPIGNLDEQVAALETKQSFYEASQSSQQKIVTKSPGTEINLRGQHAEEALDSLERYLDAAYLAGLPYVRIIHGKGTGKLRHVIREALGYNPHVKSYEPGHQNEGGEGVTVAKLDV